MKISTQKFSLAPLTLALVTLACSADPTNKPGGDGDGDFGTGSTQGNGEPGGGSSGDGDGSGGTDGSTDTGGNGNESGGTGGKIEDDGDANLTCPESLTGGPLLRRLTNNEFKNTLESAFPAIAGKWSSSFGADLVSSLGFTTQSGTLEVTKQNAREIDNTAAAIADAVVVDLATVLPCSTAADRACAAEFIDTYGKRLYRRPVATDEAEAMLVFFDEAFAKTDFPTAIGWLTRSLIHSPAVVYRSELGTVANAERILTQYEIATALAFAFTGNTPNDALLARADGNELSSPEALRGAALELINSPEGREHMQQFFGAWLEYARVTTLTKSNVSNFDTLREQMLEETRGFINAVVFDAKAGFSELLTSPSTFPSIELANFYSFSPPATDYTAVLRPETGGLGILAQGSVLSTEATANSSSPTQRGLLVLEKLLCGELPTVPPDVPEIGEPTTGVLTTRQRYEDAHTKVNPCKTCHLRFDPIGFGFEHFDEVGRYRADEGGLPIDAASHVPGGAAPLFQFDGQAALVQGLSEQATVGACSSGNLKAYVFGTQTSCLGETDRQKFIDGAIGFVDYLASLAVEPQFSRRTLD